MTIRIFHFCATFLFVAVICLLVGRKTKGISARYLIQLVVVEIVLAWILLRSGGGISFVGGIVAFFERILSFAAVGTDFVFGGLQAKGLAFVFTNVLCPIVFVSVLIGILQHFRILPIIIKVIGFILSKISGMGKLESFNAISSLFLGQSENFIVYRDILEHLPERRLYNLAATAMSTVSMSIVGSYMTMLKPEYVVIALILNMFSTFIVLTLINPYPPENDFSFDLASSHKGMNFFEMLGDYILAGFKIAIIIAAMLMGFIALIAAINYVCTLIFGISFQEIVGYIFYPFAWLLGIPISEAHQAGMIMGTKLVANEFVAMQDFQHIQGALSEKSQAIISIFLISFANFSSIAVIAGTVKGLNEKQGNVIFKFGLKLLLGSTLVSFLSAATVGLVFS